VSTDGGATFAPNVQISTGTTDATAAAAGTFNLGDYDKMDFSHGAFYRTWADNSNSTGDNPNGALNAMDIYTARVTLTLPSRAVVTPPVDQTATEGTGQSFDLGKFSDPDGGPWTVDVNWGDGSPHATFGLAAAGSLGTQPHTYAEDGLYTVTVGVMDSTSLWGSASYQVVVAEPPIIVSAPVAAKGKKLKNEVVATFTHANGVEPSTAFIALIDWGDGTPSSTGIIGRSGTTYTVTGTHTFAKGGQHTVTTTVTEVGMSPNLFGPDVGLNPSIVRAAPTGAAADIQDAALNTLMRGSPDSPVSKGPSRFLRHLKPFQGAFGEGL
jgi:hypothetical protein